MLHPVTEPVGTRDRRRGDRRAVVLGLAGIALFGLACYAGALQGPFVFDDLPEIVENPNIRRLGALFGSLEAWRHLPVRVVGYATFAVNHGLGGLAPAGYHAVNVAIHVGCAMLVLVLVRLVFETPRMRSSRIAPQSTAIGFVAGVAFVAHPLQTQGVTYVVQRFASLATLFYLGAAVAFTWWRLGVERGSLSRRGRMGGYALVLCLVVLAMRTKEVAFTAPIVLVLLEVAFFGWPGRSALPRLVLLGATLAVIPLALVRADGPRATLLVDAAAATRVQTDMGRVDYLRTQVAVVGRYLQLLVLPAGQNLDYDFPIVRSLLEPRAVAGAVAIAALLVAAGLSWWAARRRIPPADPALLLVAFGIAWFFVALSVESGFIPIVDVIFEHRAYLPSIGLFMAGAAALGLVVHRFAPSRVALVAVSLGVLVAASESVATVRRNEVWSDPVRLWRDVVAKSPRKARPHHNLGAVLLQRGELGEAREQFMLAIGLDREYTDAWMNLGVLEMRAGRLGLAIEALREASRLDPESAQVRGNLGVALLKSGSPAEAIPHLRLAVSRAPGQSRHLVHLGAALEEVGAVDEAVSSLRRAIQLDPDLPDAHANLGIALYRTGDVDGAIAEFRRAIALDPRHVEAHENLGIALGRLGRRQEAFEMMSTGMRLRAQQASQGTPGVPPGR